MFSMCFNFFVFQSFTDFIKSHTPYSRGRSYTSCNHHFAKIIQFGIPASTKHFAVRGEVLLRHEHCQRCQSHFEGEMPGRKKKNREEKGLVVHWWIISRHLFVPIRSSISFHPYVSNGLKPENNYAFFLSQVGQIRRRVTFHNRWYVYISYTPETWLTIVLFYIFFGR